MEWSTPPAHHGNGRPAAVLGAILLPVSLSIVVLVYLHGAFVGPVAIAGTCIAVTLVVQGETNFVGRTRYRLYLWRNPLEDTSRPAQSFEEAARRITHDVRKRQLLRTDRETLRWPTPAEVVGSDEHQQL